MGRLDGKRVVVTGAARGIGKHYASTLAQEGALVALADILDAEPAAAEIRAAGIGDARAFHVDVSDESSVEDMVAQVVKAFKNVDILVNNAALWADLEFKPFWEQTAGEWERVLSVNVRGVFLMTKAVFFHMRKQGHGKIVNIGSPTAEWGIPGFLHYVTSKGAVHGFTRALAREVGEFGITVNTLAPGFTLSEKVLGMGKFVQMAEESNKVRRCLKRSQFPEDVQGALLFLASSESDFMTGQLVVVDGGAVIH